MIQQGLTPVNRVFNYLVQKLPPSRLSWLVQRDPLYFNTSSGDGEATSTSVRSFKDIGAGAAENKTQATPFHSQVISPIE